MQSPIRVKAQCTMVYAHLDGREGAMLETWVGDKRCMLRVEGAASLMGQPKLNDEVWVWFTPAAPGEPIASDVPEEASKP